MSGIEFDASGLLQGLAEQEFKMKTALEAYGKTAAAKLEDHAKKNKPWENRTSNAVNSIHGFSGFGDVSGSVTMTHKGLDDQGRDLYEAEGFVAESQGGGDQLTIGVSGNMDYSVFLELAHEKQYATLWPTIEALGPEILQGMKNLLGK